MVVSTNYNFDTTIKIYDERKSSPQRCGDQVGLFRKGEEMSLHTLTVTNEAIIEAYGVVLMNGGIEGRWIKVLDRIGSQMRKIFFRRTVETDRQDRRSPNASTPKERRNRLSKVVEGNTGLRSDGPEPECVSQSLVDES